MSRSPHRVPALVLGTGHAAVSAYWLTGGTALLDTIGGSLEEWARDRSGTAVAALAAVVVVKLVTAALGPLVAVRLTFDVTMYTDHRPREDRLTRPLLALTLPRGLEAGPVPGRKETRMTRWTTRALGGAAVVASVLGSGMGAAGADPKGGVTILTCDDGTTYETVVAGNGNWTPAHDTNSNTILVPTWFGDFHGTLRDADGNVIEDFVEEGDSPKGQSATNKGDIVACTFSFTEVSDGSDPEFPEGFTFTGVGEVRGFATPRS